METGVTARVADASEIGAVAETLAGAFFNDPVWGWAFDDPARRHDQHVALWTLFVAGVSSTGGFGRRPATRRSRCGSRPAAPNSRNPTRHALNRCSTSYSDRGAHCWWTCSTASRTRILAVEDHFYLSLLGTHPDHRGRGLGMGLLAENLALIDAAGAPAYLESSNPVNLGRYQSVGFERLGEFALPEDGPSVTTMWRQRR